MPANPEEQFYRRCLNDGMPYMSKGFGMGFAIELRPEGPKFIRLRPELEEPTAQDRDLLPMAED